MDFERIKQNLRFRSGRAPNMSKRFPTLELEKRETAPPMQPQSPLLLEGRLSLLSTGSRQFQAEMPKPRFLVLQIQASFSVQERQSQNKEDSQQLPGPKKPEIKTSGSELEGYALHRGPLKPKLTSTSLEELFGLLYSEGYLNILISDPCLVSQFTSFLAKYKPSLSPSSPNTSKRKR